MKLEKWALIAEITGAAAVVVTLIFVVQGLRENTRALEAATRQGFAAQDQVFLSTNLDPAVIAVAMSKVAGGEELSLLESSQLMHRQHLNFRIFEHAYSQYERGTLELREWQRYDDIVRIVIADDEAARQMWEIFRTGFSESFREFVDDIIEGE